VSAQPIEELLAATAAGLVDAQLALDECGRDSIDAFETTGVPPTVLAWRECRVRCPVAAGLRPKQSAAERTSALLSPHGGGTVTFALRYFPRPP
jgi:hypothetical protein